MYISVIFQVSNFVVFHILELTVCRSNSILHNLNLNFIVVEPKGLLYNHING